jgi:hypothetical protein
MRWNSVSLAFLMLLDIIGGRAHTQNIYYVYDGATLQVSMRIPQMRTMRFGRFGYTNNRFTSGITLRVCRIRIGDQFRAGQS